MRHPEFLQWWDRGTLTTETPRVTSDEQGPSVVFDSSPITHHLVDASVVNVSGRSNTKFGMLHSQE